MTFILLFFLSAGAHARTVATIGFCEREVAPDRAGLVLTVEARENAAGAAGAKASKQYEKLRGEIRKLKLADMKLQTSHYNVQPLYDYENGKARARGYQAVMSLDLETSEIARMGEVIELVSKLGVQNVSQLNMFLSPEKQRSEHEGCLEEAVRNARQKAERLAKAEGAKVGPVQTIEESKRMDSSPVPPMPMMAMAKSESGPVMETRAQRVQVTVHATFSLK